MLKLIIGYFLAAVFWFIMFSPWTSHAVNFWIMMLIATGSLTLFSLFFGKENLKDIYKWKPNPIAVGLISAGFLYMIFWSGNYISKEIFDFAEQQITGIYNTKEQADKIFIGSALFFWIGPAEEIFWRGFAQNVLSKNLAPYSAFLINSVIYASVHIWSFNFMLIMAALICGLFWGFMLMKFKNVIACVLSHAIWDLLVFIIIPFN